MTEQTEEAQLRIACTLPADELASRKQEIDTRLANGVQSTTELSDGYEFRFPGDVAWLIKLVDFVREERECCRFLTFELLFEPNEGPITLRLRGADGAKDFIKEMI